MKLLYLTHEDVNRTAVAKAMMYDIARYFSNKYDVTVISASDKKKKKDRRFQDGNLKNIKFYRAVYGSMNFFDVVYLFLFSITIINTIRKNDVIYVRSYPMMLFGIIAKVMSKKVIFDPRGLGFLEMIDSERVSRFLSDNKLSSIENMFIRYSDFVICVSDAHKKYYIEHYGMEDKYKVVYNGTKNVFDKEVLDYSNDDIFKIVYLGSLIKWHCPERVNSLLVTLMEKEVDFEFHCITKDIDKAKSIFTGSYQKKIYSHSYREQPIKFNLGICLIENTVSKSACFPVKFSEYLSSGTPVLFSENVDVCKQVAKISHVGLGVSLDSNNEVIADSVISYLNGEHEPVSLPDKLTMQSMINEIEHVLNECSG